MKIISTISDKKPQNNYLKIGNNTIYFEIADNPYKKMKGLSDRKYLKEESGMLFIYQKAAQYPFWMKDMHFNLDFIFIYNDKIVDLKENIPCPENNQPPQTVNSSKSFDKLLEVNAGTIKKLNIKKGQKVSFTF